MASIPWPWKRSGLVCTRVLMTSRGTAPLCEMQQARPPETVVLARSKAGISAASQRSRPLLPAEEGAALRSSSLFSMSGELLLNERACGAARRRRPCAPSPEDPEETAAVSTAVIDAAAIVARF